MGGMGVRKNVFIEEWAGRRENLEHVFRYSKGNWARLAVFGIGVPLAVYHCTCSEMVSFFLPPPPPWTPPLTYCIRVEPPRLLLTDMRCNVRLNTILSPTLQISDGSNSNTFGLGSKGMKQVFLGGYDEKRNK